VLTCTVTAPDWSSFNVFAQQLLLPDWSMSHMHACTHTHTHTHLTAFCPGLPGWTGTRKVKSVWILLKQETVSGISLAICKPAPRSRHITMPASHRMPFLPPSQQRQSSEGHWLKHVSCQKSYLTRVPTTAEFHSLSSGQWCVCSRNNWNLSFCLQLKCNFVLICLISSGLF